MKKILLLSAGLFFSFITLGQTAEDAANQLISAAQNADMTLLDGLCNSESEGSVACFCTLAPGVEPEGCASPISEADFIADFSLASLDGQKETLENTTILSIQHGPSGTESGILVLRKTGSEWFLVSFD